MALFPDSVKGEGLAAARRTPARRHKNWTAALIFYPQLVLSPPLEAVVKGWNDGLQRWA